MELNKGQMIWLLDWAKLQEMDELSTTSTSEKVRMAVVRPLSKGRGRVYRLVSSWGMVVAVTLIFFTVKCLAENYFRR